MFRVPKSTTPSSTPSVIVKRIRQTIGCLYPAYECPQPCLEGYTYCMKHILEDPNAPYRQCGFVYNTNGRKCQNPAPKTDKRDISYCAEHTRKAQMARIKSTSRHSLPETPEMLLLNLSHYVKPYDSSAEDTEEEEGKVKSLDPFTEVDAAKVNASGSDILDYASSSDSDAEPSLVTDTLRGSFLDDSDNESLHSPQEDPLNINFLRHAGIYTAEEVIYIAREKLIRLQSLYIDQFRKLQYTLKEKRRKYLQALKKEKETYSSIHAQQKKTPKEKKMYEKLKALIRYRKHSGVEGVCYKKLLERRAQATDGSTQKPPNVTKCIFTEGGVKCGERTLPAAKHCRKHILKDQHQVLFKACGVVCADIECHEPVPVMFDSNCVFHMDLPPPCKLESMKFEEVKPSVPSLLTDNQSLEIDVVGEPQEIDPDDDMAGLMREMSDAARAKPAFNESLNSEASTDTAFSLSAQMSDKDDLVSA